MIGANKSGKSNVIEAFKTLKSISQGKLHTNFTDLVFDRGDGNITFELEFELLAHDMQRIVGYFTQQKEFFSDFDLNKEQLFRFIRYKIEFDGRGLVHEEFKVSNQDATLISLIRNEIGSDGTGICHFIDLENYFAKRKDTLLLETEEMLTDQINLGKQFRILARGQGSIAFKIGDLVDEFVNQIKIMSITRQAAPQLPAKEEYELETDGRNLVTVLNTIRNHTDDFPELGKWIQKILGEPDTRVYAPPVESYITVMLDEHGLQTRTSLANLSKGIEQILISLLMFEKRKGSVISLLCIEEPEVHLHSSAQKKLFEYFREKSSEIQLVITTHSSLFTSLDNGTKLYLIYKKDGISIRERIEKESHLILVRRILGVSNSDVYGADCVIFLEDPVDVSSFETVAKFLNYDQIGKNIFVDSLDGTDNSPNLPFLFRYLRRSQCNFFAILDNHTKNVNIKNRLITDKLAEKEDIIIRNKQFEDLFDSDSIIECMVELSKEESFKFNLTSVELEEQRSDSDVAKILRNLPNIIFDDYKRRLAKKLIDITIKKIIEDKNNTRSKSDFENEIIRIMDRVSLKRPNDKKGPS